MDIEERLVRDAQAVEEDMEDFDEQGLLARIYRTLGIASSGDVSAAGHSVVAGSAGGAVDHHPGGCCGRAAANQP